MVRWVFVAGLCLTATSATAAGETRRAEPRGVMGATITTDDYPRNVNAAVAHGVTTMRYKIDDKGRVVRGSCGLVSSSGFAELDAVSCFLAERRFRFKPALKDGQPVEEARTQSTFWMHPAYPLNVTPRLVRQSVPGRAMCIVKRHPAAAERLLTYPYRSAEQIAFLATPELGRDCLGQLAISYPPASLAGAIAEEIVEAAFPFGEQLPSHQLAAPPVPPTLLNVDEQLGHCLFRRNPTAGTALMYTTPTGHNEDEVMADLIKHLPACVPPGETWKLDKSSIRSLIAVAIYRDWSAAKARPAQP